MKKDKKEDQKKTQKQVVNILNIATVLRNEMKQKLMALFEQAEQQRKVAERFKLPEGALQFESMKEQRIKFFAEYILPKCIEKQKQDGTEATTFDKSCYKMAWLNDESKLIESMPLKNISFRDQQEFLKFKEWVKKERKREGEKIRRANNKQAKDAMPNPNKNFSPKEIAIAYNVMNINITSANADEILKRHSQKRSVEKLLTKRIYNLNDQTLISGNKTADTKHLNVLIAAKRLVSGMEKHWKNKNAIIDIDRIITDFQASYDREY